MFFCDTAALWKLYVHPYLLILLLFINFVNSATI